MSEFLEICVSKNLREFEERRWAWTKHLLVKWQAKGLSETEAQRLLYLWAEELIPTYLYRFNRLKKRLLKDKRPRPDGLLMAAVRYGKDTRTIRRWCEKGFFPRAKRTKGGHWRIPFKAINEARAHIPPGIVRNPKSIFGTKVWREFKAEAEALFFRGMTSMVELEAAAQNKTDAEMRAGKSDSNSLPPSQAVYDVYQRARTAKRLDFARLCALARRLYLHDRHRRLTRYNLAAFSKTSIATLYRRFSRAEIRAAIKGAVQPIIADGGENGRPEPSEHDYVTSLTSEVRPE